ncbi:unnamed protein product [Calicophoron daubneyi]|uniref:Trematode PH-like domain-containing protein n=1 Tax=Calicophoron daubneyi TaxID=300641 RepID=A0AAV2THN3_CALDB
MPRRKDSAINSIETTSVSMSTPSGLNELAIFRCLAQRLGRTTASRRHMFSAEEAEKLMMRHTKKKSTPTVIVCLEDRMTFKKTTPRVPKGFRTSVTYQDIKHIYIYSQDPQLFVLCITDSTIKNKKFYETFRGTNSNDVNELCRITAEAKASPNSRLQSRTTIPSNSLRKKQIMQANQDPPAKYQNTTQPDHSKLDAKEYGLIYSKNTGNADSKTQDSNRSRRIPELTNGSVRGRALSETTEDWRCSSCESVDRKYHATKEHLAGEHLKGADTMKEQTAVGAKKNITINYCDEDYPKETRKYSRRLNDEYESEIPKHQKEKSSNYYNASRNSGEYSDYVNNLPETRGRADRDVSRGRKDVSDRYDDLEEDYDRIEKSRSAKSHTRAPKQNGDVPDADANRKKGFFDKTKDTFNKGFSKVKKGATDGYDEVAKTPKKIENSKVGGAFHHSRKERGNSHDADINGDSDYLDADEDRVNRNVSKGRRDVSDFADDLSDTHGRTNRSRRTKNYRSPSRQSGNVFYVGSDERSDYVEEVEGKTNRDVSRGRKDVSDRYDDLEENYDRIEKSRSAKFHTRTPKQNGDVPDADANRKKGFFDKTKDTFNKGFSKVKKGATDGYDEVAKTPKKIENSKVGGAFHHSRKERGNSYDADINGDSDYLDADEDRVNRNVSKGRRDVSDFADDLSDTHGRTNRSRRTKNYRSPSRQSGNVFYVGSDGRSDYVEEVEEKTNRNVSRDRGDASNRVDESPDSHRKTDKSKGTKNYRSPSRQSGNVFYVEPKPGGDKGEKGAGKRPRAGKEKFSHDDVQAVKTQPVSAPANVPPADQSYPSNYRKSDKQEFGRARSENDIHCISTQNMNDFPAHEAHMTPEVINRLFGTNVTYVNRRGGNNLEVGDKGSIFLYATRSDILQPYKGNDLYSAKSSRTLPGNNR